MQWGLGMIFFFSTQTGQEVDRSYPGTASASSSDNLLSNSGVRSEPAEGALVWFLGLERFQSLGSSSVSETFWKSLPVKTFVSLLVERTCRRTRRRQPRPLTDSTSVTVAGVKP